MNARIIRALVWEQYSKTRVLWLCAFGIPVLGSLGAYLIVQTDEASMVYAVHAASRLLYQSLWAALLLYVAGILYLQNGTRDLQLLMPGSQLRRPVSTGVLVACRYFYDVLSTGLLAVAALVFFAVVLPKRVSTGFDGWILLPYVLGITATVRTLAWTLGGLGSLSVAVLGDLILLAMGLLLFAVVGNSYLNFQVTIPLAVAVFFIGYVLSLIAVSRQRSGQHLSWSPLWALLARRGVRGSVASAPFGGPEEAVRWFEQRRQSYRYLGILGALYLGCFGPFTLFMAHHNYRALPFSGWTTAGIYSDAALMGLVMALGYATPLAGGLFLFMNQRMYIGPAGRFLYTRPVATQALAQGRLHATATRVLVTLVPLVALTLLTLDIDLRAPENMLLNGLLPHYGLLGMMLIIALAFLGILGISWGGIWLANAIPVGVAYLVISALLDSLGVPSQHRDETALLLCLVGCVCALGWFALQCRRRGLLDRRVGVQVIVTVTVLSLGYPLLYNFGSVEAGTIARFGWYWSWGIPVAIAVAVAPFLTVPLSMDWARHR